jgi:hypothetical protein
MPTAIIAKASGTCSSTSANSAAIPVTPIAVEVIARIPTTGRDGDP